MLADVHDMVSMANSYGATGDRSSYQAVSGSGTLLASNWLSGPNGGIASAAELGTTDGAKTLEASFTNATPTEQQQMLRRLGSHAFYHLGGGLDFAATAKHLSDSGLDINYRTFALNPQKGGAAPAPSDMIAPTDLDSLSGRSKLRNYYNALPKSDQMNFANNLRAYAKYDTKGNFDIDGTASALAQANEGINLQRMAPIDMTATDTH